MSGTLYTLGYAAPDAAKELERLMSNPKALLVDIRLSPRSRWPQWNGTHLRTRFGAGRYTHEYRLGNKNYKKKEQPIELAGPQYEGSISGAVLALEHGRDLVLLCACSNYETCHRKVVAEMIQARLAGRCVEGVLS